MNEGAIRIREALTVFPVLLATTAEARGGVQRDVREWNACGTVYRPDIAPGAWAGQFR